MKSKTPEYRAAYWRQYRQTNKPYIGKLCVLCGATFRKHSVLDGTAKTCLACRLGTCATCGEKFKRGKLSQRFCSRACRYEPMKGKEPEALSAKRGRKPRTYHLTKRDKHGSAEDRDWRKAVFERDDYTCTICGQRGGRLQADHIKPFKEFPALRHVLGNGRTLCVPCHVKTPTYGWSAYWHKLNRAKKEAP